MSKLLIIGAGNFGREMESWISLIPNEQKNWEFGGFLHTNLSEYPLDEFPTDTKIVGDWNNFEFSPDDYCIIAVADIEWRKKIFNHLKEKVRFYTYIAPNAIIGNYNAIGEGSIICPNCLISTNVRIGKQSIINFGTQIGHDVTIGDFSSIMPSNTICGNVTIGNDVFSGAGVTIIPKIEITNKTIIGAGSVIFTNVTKEGITLFGNPARPVIQK